MAKIKALLNKNKKVIFEIVAILIIALFSYSLAPKTLQNDTFYTIPIGNLIMENGIDMKDHFSWHEDLPYTYPHWLYDVIMAKIYNFGGWNAIYSSVCVLSIFMGILIYEVNRKLNKNQIISFLITIGAMYLLKSYIAARAQLVTFIIYIGVIYFIEKFLQNPKKIIYAIGIICSSILIANLHIAVWPFFFVVFLPYIAEYFIAILSDIIIYKKINIFIKKRQLKKYKNDNEKLEKINNSLNEIFETNKKVEEYRKTQNKYKIRIEKNKNVKWLILIMIICIGTGLLTPLGTNPYTYLIKTMQGNTTKNINEHLPLTLINDTEILCTIVILVATLTFTKVKIRLSDLFMIGGLTYLMFFSKRQSTMFVIFGSIILNRLLIECIDIYGIKESLKKKVNNFFKIGFIVLGMCLIAIFSFDNIYNNRNRPFVSENTYPVKAADWILENLDINNIKLFNEYNYGSYLIFKGIPVFIDSRADLYAPEFNGRTDDIFMEFINTSGIGKFYGNTFKNYGITHVIVYKNSKMSMIIDNADRENYNKIYSDDSFVIYEIIK